MKVFIRDLMNISDQKVYNVDIPSIDIKDNIFLNGIKNIKGEIVFYYDYDEKLKIEYELSGTMICPNSLTLKDVEVPFEIYDDLFVVFKQNEDGFYLIDGMDFNDFVAYIISPEAPISVEKNNETMYHSGDGWSIYSEQSYKDATKDRIDPRLAKLLEYKEED